MHSTGGRPTPVWNPAPEVVDRLRRSTTQVWAAPGVTDLGVGQPDLSLLPAELLQSAFAHEPLAARSPLQYGGPLGDGLFRLALGEFLTGAYGVETDPGTMLISNGNSQAIDLVCATLTRPGDVVFVEEPTYFLALEIFRSHGVRLVGIPVDDDGMSIDALETALATYRPALVYTIPTFHNPMGVTMTAERRERLIELAEEHEFLVLADEVYHLLDFPGTAAVPLPLAAAVHTGVVISLGTFSKILAPGLRLGWVQAAPAVLARLAEAPVITSGGGLNPFVSTIVRSMLEHGWLGDHLASVQGRLAARAAVQVKDKARGEAVAIVRSTVKKINGNPEVDNALRAKAALPAHEVRAAIGVPATRPIGRIEPSASRTLIVHFVDEMTPQRTAKPYGVHGCQIWSFVGENPPADGSGFAFLALDTRTPYTDVHTDIDAGKTVHYRLRWANTKGEPGPWSAVVAAKIPL